MKKSQNITNYERMRDELSYRGKTEKQIEEPEDSINVIDEIFGGEDE